MREGAFYTRRVSGKMTRRHSVRLLFLISLALEMIHVGNSYQREKYKRSREEINNAPAQKLQQKTLNWTLNNFREMNDSADGWRPRGAFPHSPALQEQGSAELTPRRPHRCAPAPALLQERRHLRAGQLLRVPRPLHRSLLRARPEAQRMRRPGARSLDLPRLPPLQVRLCGPALPPPPDTRPLRSERLPGLPR
ncbi:cryptic protein isoform X2 [Camelus ferus]|uniref:Cryptic protein isoform X2 n=1 Tax=Camelus ferus TaxID=419612 RepID=A0A8B8SYM8_CAMFR|nr:cryptic protein isoform X2 [Camelus ferus]